MSLPLSFVSTPRPETRDKTHATPIASSALATPTQTPNEQSLDPHRRRRRDTPKPTVLRALMGIHNGVATTPTPDHNRNRNLSTVASTPQPMFKTTLSRPKDSPHIAKTASIRNNLPTTPTTNHVDDNDILTQFLSNTQDGSLSTSGIPVSEHDAYAHKKQEAEFNARLQALLRQYKRHVRLQHSATCSLEELRKQKQQTLLKRRKQQGMTTRQVRKAQTLIAQRMGWIRTNHTVPDALIVEQRDASDTVNETTLQYESIKPTIVHKNKASWKTTMQTKEHRSCVKINLARVDICQYSQDEPVTHIVRPVQVLTTTSPFPTKSKPSTEMLLLGSKQVGV